MNIGMQVNTHEENVLYIVQFVILKIIYYYFFIFVLMYFVWLSVSYQSQLRVFTIFPGPDFFLIFLIFFDSMYCHHCCCISFVSFLYALNLTYASFASYMPRIFFIYLSATMVLFNLNVGVSSSVLLLKSEGRIVNF